jgi:hypothetical protein
MASSGKGKIPPNPILVQASVFSQNTIVPVYTENHRSARRDVAQLTVSQG